MRRYPRAVLRDVLERAEAILEFVRGREQSDDVSDAMLLAAVERKLENHQ